MPVPVVIVASGGLPIVNVSLGVPMTPVTETGKLSGKPVTLVTESGKLMAMAVYLVNDDLTAWTP